VSVDVNFDIVDERLHGYVGATLDLFVGDQGEEAFDLIEPGRRCRREVHMPVRRLGEPGADQLGFVGRRIVHHDVDVEPIWDIARDLVEELAKLACSVAWRALADH
jgi:hypothetical protein